VKVRFRDREWKLEGERLVREAVEEVGLSPEKLLVVRDGEVLDEDAKLEEDDEIRLLALISGG
jgi:sulfur carrier protein ThiS